MPRYKKGEIDWKTFVLLNKKLDIEFLLEE
jgi:hypothetical protein